MLFGHASRLMGLSQSDAAPQQAMQHYQNALLYFTQCHDTDYTFPHVEIVRQAISRLKEQPFSQSSLPVT